MGHREDLLDGAKRCILEKGYARTTARDIVAASGTNLASIGYHYGSKEALLNAALMEAIGEVGDEVTGPVLENLDPDVSQLERFEAFWTRLLELLPQHRNVWAASVEIYGQIERMPELRAQAVAGYEDGRVLWASQLADVDAAEDPELARAVGTFHMALIVGVVVQCLVDPEHAPSAKDLVRALQVIAAGVSTP